MILVWKITAPYLLFEYMYLNAKLA